MPKYGGETKFQLREYPRSGSKAMSEEEEREREREKERKSVLTMASYTCKRVEELSTLDKNVQLRIAN